MNLNCSEITNYLNELKILAQFNLLMIEPDCIPIIPGSERVFNINLFHYFHCLFFTWIWDALFRIAMWYSVIDIFWRILFTFGFHSDEFNKREFFGLQRICCWGNCRLKLPPRNFPQQKIKLFFNLAMNNRTKFSTYISLERANEFSGLLCELKCISINENSRWWFYRMKISIVCHVKGYWMKIYIRTIMN